MSEIPLDLSNLFSIASIVARNHPGIIASAPSRSPSSWYAVPDGGSGRPPDEAHRGRISVV